MKPATHTSFAERTGRMLARLWSGFVPSRIGIGLPPSDSSDAADAARQEIERIRELARQWRDSIRA